MNTEWVTRELKFLTEEDLVARLKHVEAVHEEVKKVLKERGIWIQLELPL